MKLLLACTVVFQLACDAKLMVPDCSKDRCKFHGSLHLIIVGDTGGVHIKPGVTKVQKAVAEVIRKLSHDAAAVINVGDNFYYVGVQNIHDPRFQDTFENVYAADKLPWYMIAGNHDHFGNITAQVKYSERSQKWHFPSLYYPLHYGTPEFTVDIVMLDTIVLCGNTRDLEFSSNLEYFTKAIMKKITSKAHYEMRPADVKAAEKQWKWIEHQLQSSTATYLFVAGHYPIYSAASHGSTGCLQKRLDPLLRKYHVNAYFAGHDHNLQHLRVAGMDYFVSGAGSRSERGYKHMKNVPAGSLLFSYPEPKPGVSIPIPIKTACQTGFCKGGIADLKIDANRAVLRFYNEEGDSIHEAVMKPRKQ